MDEQHSLHRFKRLFKGNPRTFGQWNPKSPKGKDSHTIHQEYGDDQVEAHLTGRMGLGLVPIMDNNTVTWGAIDLDNHGDTKDMDIRGVERKVAAKNLPLVACRSKSGGVHLYAFFSEPVRADMVKTVLTRWAKELEVEGVDCIYPKQGRLPKDEDGKQQYGNWINLPYFGDMVEGENTVRFAVANGKRLTLDSFLLKAETGAMSAAQLQQVFSDDLSELPPCLKARMQSGGFEGGERNDGTYNVAVFCRKRDPDSAKEAAHDLSIKLMPDNPLQFKERDKTIKSATSGRSYNYKCEVFSDVCDREACRKLKYGISESEYDQMAGRAAMPRFHSLVKFHNADPIRFDLSVGDEETSRKIEGLTIDELVMFPELRKAVMARMHIVLPRLKADEWDKILKSLFDEVVLEAVPEDSTPEGQVRVRLHEFLRKADLTNEGTEAKDRERLLRGQPVVQLYRDERVVMFRHADFVGYLTKTRTDAIKNKDLWFRASRGMGVADTRLRIGKTVVPVWYLSVSEIEEQEQHAKDFTPEY